MLCPKWPIVTHHMQMTFRFVSHIRAIYDDIEYIRRLRKSQCRLEFSLTMAADGISPALASKY